MKSQLATLALSTALIAAAPLTAAADTMAIPAAAGNAPVQINAVLADRPEGTYQRWVYPRTVAITFTNISPAAAKDVVFGLRDNLGRLVDTFHDSGTFAQGVAISHRFTSTGVARQEQLDVEQATFGNGTVWHNGDVNPLSRRQAAAVTFDLPTFPEAF